MPRAKLVSCVELEAGLAAGLAAYTANTMARRLHAPHLRHRGRLSRSLSRFVSCTLGLQLSSRQLPLHRTQPPLQGLSPSDRHLRLCLGVFGGSGLLPRRSERVLKILWAAPTCSAPKQSRQKPCLGFRLLHAYAQTRGMDRPMTNPHNTFTAAYG